MSVQTELHLQHLYDFPGRDPSQRDAYKTPQVKTEKGPEVFGPETRLRLQLAVQMPGISPYLNVQVAFCSGLQQGLLQCLPCANGS